MAKTKTKIPLLVLLTDTHLEEDNINTNIEIYKQAREKAKELGFKKVYHAGDIFDSRKAQTEKVLNVFKSILDEFEQEEMQLIAIPGNHDKTYYPGEASFLDPFARHPAFVLVTKPMLVTMTETVKVYMAPFYSDSAYLSSLVESRVLIESGESKLDCVLITHVGLDGAIMNNGIAVKSLIHENVFDTFKLVLIGHYHNASDYSDKIKYIGSSIQHNHGETTDKGLTILYNNLSTELIRLDFPKYINYEVNVKNLKLKEIEAIKKEKENSNDHIRITLTGTEQDIKAFDASRLKVLGVDVKKKQDVIIAAEVEQRVEAFNDTSLLGAFKTFCEKYELEHEEGIVYINKALNIN